MADNVTLPGTAAVVATDDVGGVQYQVVKLAIGADGAATLIDSSNLLPATVSGVIPGAGATQLGKAEDSPHASGDVGVMMMGVRNDSDATLAGTTGDYTPPQFDANGYLKVNIKAGAPAGGTSMADDAAFSVASTAGTPVGGTYKATLDAVDDGDFGVFAMTAKRAQYVSHLTPLGDTMVDDTLDALNVKVVGGSIAGIADDAAFVVGTSELLPVGFLADETATDSVNEGDLGAGRMTLDRKQIVTDQPHSAGGCSNYTALSTGAVLTAAIKASPGNLYSLECYNVNAAARYVRLYNMTTAPASTDTASVVWQGVIPGATTGGGFVITWPKGKFFSTGIGIRASTGIAHNDTGVLGANELTFNASYT